MSDFWLKLLFFFLFEVVGAWNGMSSVFQWKDYLKTTKSFPLFLSFLHIINGLTCAAGAIWVLFRV